jgi:hypothetical protein
MLAVEQRAAAPGSLAAIESAGSSVCRRAVDMLSRPRTSAGALPTGQLQRLTSNECTTELAQFACPCSPQLCAWTQPSACSRPPQVVIQELRGRMGFLGAVRGLQQLSPGVVDAPLGCATVVALHLQGTAVIQSWNSSAAAMSLKLLHDTAGYHLRKYPAYMVCLGMHAGWGRRASAAVAARQCRM